MLGDKDYEAALVKPKVPPVSEPSPNYTKTKDPNVMIGKSGLKITKDDMDYANKHGMAWMNLDSFADWLGGWAKKVPDFSQVSPYYRTYGGTPNIPGTDIALLMSKNDPSINAILQRNIAKEGEVPMFGPDDADALRKLIANEKNKPSDDQYLQMVKNTE